MPHNERVSLLLREKPILGAIVVSQVAKYEVEARGESRLDTAVVDRGPLRAIEAGAVLHEWMKGVICSLGQMRAVQAPDQTAGPAGRQVPAYTDALSVAELACSVAEIPCRAAVMPGPRCSDGSTRMPSDGLAGFHTISPGRDQMYCSSIIESAASG